MPTNRLFFAAGLISLWLMGGCAPSVDSFKSTMAWKPIPAEKRIDLHVRVEPIHRFGPELAKWASEEHMANRGKAVEAALLEDSIQSGVFASVNAPGREPDVLIRAECLEYNTDPMLLPSGNWYQATLSVAEPRTGRVLKEYARKRNAPNLTPKWGEEFQGHMSTMLAEIRRELAADFESGELRQVATAARAERAARALLQAVDAAQARGDAVAAAAAVRQALASDPNGAAAVATAVTLLHRLCDPDGARRLGEEALKRHPADAALAAALTGAGVTPDRKLCEAQALNKEGVALARAGQRTEALSKLEAARKLAPGLIPKASYNAGLILEQSGRAPEALAAYVEARRGFLDPAEEQEALGRMTALAQRAKLPAPDSADRRYRLGIVRAQQKRYAEAVTEFEAALAEAPWITDAYYNLGLVCDFAERPAEALAALKTYLSLAPDSPHLGAVKTKVVELEDKLAAGTPPAK